MATPIDPTAWYTTAEAAALLSLSPAGIRRRLSKAHTHDSTHIQKRKVDGQRGGHTWCIQGTALQKWVDNEPDNNHVELDELRAKYQQLEQRLADTNATHAMAEMDSLREENQRLQQELTKLKKLVGDMAAALTQ